MRGGGGNSEGSARLRGSPEMMPTSEPLYGKDKDLGVEPKGVKRGTVYVGFKIFFIYFFKKRV